MKKIFFLIILTSCVSLDSSETKTSEILSFNDNLTFNEFNRLLKRYSEISNYPNIDQ